MNEKAKKKWIEAARSNKYEQIGSLYGGSNGTTKCCILGVLTDVSGLGEWVEDGVYVVRTLGGVADYLWEDFIRDECKDEALLAKYLHSSGYVSPPEDLEDVPEQCFYGEEEGLHPLVAKWAGVESGLGLEVDYVKKTPLHVLNDTMKLSFEELAELIEEQL